MSTKPGELQAKALTDARVKAAGLRELARKGRAQAWTNFEASVCAVENKAEAADLDTATPTRSSILGDSTAR